MIYWSVVQTESRREHVAAEFLRREAFEVYLPQTMIKSADGKRRRIVPLFPGYLFIGIVDRWYQIKWTIGVVGLLMAVDRPARVPDGVVAAIKRREGRDGLVRLPKPRGMQRGDRVRVLHGSFEGRIGVFAGMAGPARSRLLLDLMGQQVTIVLGNRDVQPLA